MATNQALIHYALDLETPPLLACDVVPPVTFTIDPVNVTCQNCMRHEEFPIGVLHTPMRPDQERALIRPRPDEAPIVRPYAVLMNAADLLSDDGENEEYASSHLDHLRLFPI